MYAEHNSPELLMQLLSYCPLSFPHILVTVCSVLFFSAQQIYSLSCLIVTFRPSAVSSLSTRTSERTVSNHHKAELHKCMPIFM